MKKGEHQFYGGPINAGFVSREANGGELGRSDTRRTLSPPRLSNCYTTVFIVLIACRKVSEFIEIFALRDSPLAYFRESFRGVRRAISPNSPSGGLVVRLHDAAMKVRDAGSTSICTRAVSMDRNNHPPVCGKPRQSILATSSSWRSGICSREFFVERMDQNEEIFVRFMNDPAFQKVVTNLFSGPL